MFSACWKRAVLGRSAAQKGTCLSMVGVCMYLSV